MVDFSRLLQKPAGEAKKPRALPPGLYQGVIKGHKVDQRDIKGKPTPMFSFSLGLVAWPEGLDAEDQEGIELRSRQQTKDYFINMKEDGSGEPTDDAFWPIDELCRSCGIEPGGRNYQEVLPELVGKMVTIDIKQAMTTGDVPQMVNRVGRVIGEEG